jgi:hypothetical protein
MSDGPHQSLPMRPSWRKVAERCDKRAYTAEEISQALAPALECDCCDDMTPQFLRGVRRIVEEPSLFPNDAAQRLETLRPQAGAGIGRSFLDNVNLLSSSDVDGVTLLQDALKAALVDRANRGARQVEEHYLRKASAPRASNVRGRLEEGIACADLHELATRVLSVDPKSTPRGPFKQKGLDDGVSLR